LLGEAWFAQRAVTPAVLQREAARLEHRQPPPLHRREPVRALFVPAIAKGAPRRFGPVHVVTLDDLLA
jgi:hypothetical protein